MQQNYVRGQIYIDIHPSQPRKVDKRKNKYDLKSD